MLNWLFLNPYLSYRVAPLPTPLPPPPQGTERFLIGPPGRQIEILHSPPASGSSTPPGQKRPTFILQHGGFGRAECYANFLPALAGRGYSSYAVSLRGHGYSWRPSFLGMIFTTQHTMAQEDLAVAVQWIREREGQTIPLVVAGHSAGGAMVQYATSQGILGKVDKLILLAAFPPFGGASVFQSWYIQLDPWALPRLLLHFMHPRSALSTPLLLKNAFFSAGYPLSAAKQLCDHIPTVESLVWPFSVTHPFVNTKEVLENVEGGKNSLLVLAGGEDKLMRPYIMRQAAQVYGSQYEEVKGSGHHVMLDLYWEDALEKVVKFIEG